MSARERIRQLIERWFLTEPLLFSLWTTHSLTIEPRIRTIRVRHGKIEYNPDFINGLNKRKLDMVLRCEAVRILLKHPYSRRKENSNFTYTASNITLQEYLKTELPLPFAKDVFGSDKFDQQYFEFYYYKLQELADQIAIESLSNNGMTGGHASSSGKKSSQAKSDDGTGGEQRDKHDEQSIDDIGESDDSKTTNSDSDHDEGKEESAMSEQSPLEQYADAESCGKENTQDWDRDELLGDRINEKISTAQDTNSWGTVAGKLREFILANLKPKLDYRTVLRQFRASILSVNRILTRMKPSRRYGFLYMGSRRDFTTRLLFAVDVSGSIGSEDLERGFSIINQFFKYGVESIDVIQFDTEIKGKPLSLKKARYTIKALGRGGTDFRPVMEYIDEQRNYDGLIIFTDGYAPIPAKPKNRKTRIMWLFNNETNYQFMHQALKSIGKAAFLKED